jgi:hypothetical protein
MAWNLVMLREYYQRFRPAQQQQEQQQHDSQQPQQAQAPKRSRNGKQQPRVSHGHSLRIVNASQPFHLLPLAEGSASVELADPDNDGAASPPSVAASSSFSGAARASPSKPLLALAFLEAVLHRVDGFFAQHQSLQRAFADYVRRCAVASSAVHEGAAGAQVTVAQSLPSPCSHPLLGSLLLYWQVPSPHALRAGLVTLRQVRLVPALAHVQRPLLASMLWPSMLPQAVRAICQAIA